MSLELLNTVAAVVTVLIVAATAIATLIQLRHLRAGNQIQAFISIGEKLDGRVFTDALALVNTGIETALADPAFREYEIARFRRLAPAAIDQPYMDMHHAAVLVGNTFELMSLLIRNGVVDRAMFVDQYCGVVLGAWNRLRSYTALGRDVGVANGWEGFEYLAVLCEDWLAAHPTSYPKGVRRLELHNPWPVPAPDSSTKGDPDGDVARREASGVTTSRND